MSTEAPPQDTAEPEAAPLQAENHPSPSDEELRESKVMAVWKDASRLFSGLRYGISNPIDTWFQTRRQFGDTITSSHKLRYWQKLRALTDTLDDVEVEYLHTLATKRYEFSGAIFRMNAITSITIPVTAAVVSNQIYPGIVQKLLAEDSLILMGILLILLTMLVMVFGNVFKARELRMALDLEVARRRLHRGDLGHLSREAESEFDLDSPIT